MSALAGKPAALARRRPRNGGAAFAVPGDRLSPDPIRFDPKPTTATLNSGASPSRPRVKRRKVAK